MLCAAAKYLGFYPEGLVFRKGGGVGTRWGFPCCVGTSKLSVLRDGTTQPPPVGGSPKPLVPEEAFWGGVPLPNPIPAFRGG